MCVPESWEAWLYPESERLAAQGGSDTWVDMVLPVGGFQQILVSPPYPGESRGLGQVRPGERGKVELTKVRVYPMGPGRDWAREAGALGLVVPHTRL